MNRFNGFHFVVLGSVILGLAMIILSFTNSAVLPKSELAQLNGQIEWLEVKGRYNDTLAFKFKGIDTYLVYSSIGGHISEVHSALKTPRATFSVLYDHTSSHTPPFGSHPYFTIYELAKDGVTVRSYESIVASYAENNGLGFWVGLAFLSIPVIFIVLIVRYSRNRRL